MKPKFFADRAKFRAWIEKNHGSEGELWVGFYKKASGKASVTYPEALDEALCFGWIDGVRKSVDEISYVQRFTPRKPKSNWSVVNIRRMKVLIRDGRVHAAGLKTFAARDKAGSEKYSYEQRKKAALPSEMLKKFRANAKAWDFFSAQAPGYQRVAAWWVISAKQEATRERRLATLIADSGAGRKLRQFVSAKAKKGK